MSALPVRPRYVFVAGLHRSGTSVVARLIGSHPDVAAISGAPVPENEGCYLQGAIPHTARHGIPGVFAADPAEHLIEGGPFDRLDVALRLERDWDPWFAAGRRWRVEKSPVNLTRMRLYQALFPLSQFVVVVRHPAVVAAATAKWSDAPAPALEAYWRAAHERVRGDLPYLHAALVLRYEDLVADPARASARLEAFLDLPPGMRAEPLVDGNAAYAAQVAASDAADAGFGYASGGRVEPFAGLIQHPLRAVRDAAARA